MIFNQLRFLFQEKLLCLDDIIFPDFIKGASIQAVNLILFVISLGTKTTSARFWPWMWAFILPSVVIVTFFNVSIIRLQIKHVLKCAQPSGLPEEAGSGEKLLNLPVCFGGSVICRCLDPQGQCPTFLCPRTGSRIDQETFWVTWLGLRTAAQFGSVRRESSESCNIILDLMGIKLYFSAITMSEVKFDWSFVFDSFICLGPPKPFLREWENSWYSNSLHDLSFKWQKSLLSKAYFSFRKIRLNPGLRVFWWVV